MASNSTTFNTGLCSGSTKLNRNCMSEKIEITSKSLTEGSVVKKDYNGEQRLSWEGTGTFDDIVEAFSENLRLQYDNGRIQGNDYAKAYYNIIGTAMTQAIDVEYKNQELALKSIEMCFRKDIECVKLQVELEKLELEKQKIELEKQKLREDVNLKKLQQENIIANTRVYERQLQGFEDNLKLKLLGIQYDAFAMIFSSGMLDKPTMPKSLEVSDLDNAYNAVLAETKKTNRRYAVDNRIASRTNLYL